MESHVPIAGNVLRQLLDKQHAQATKSEFDTGAIIYERGDSPDYFYLIEAGEIRLLFVDGGNVRLLDILGPGDWLGSASLARVPEHRNRAVAASHAIIWAFPIDSLIQTIRSDGEMALLIIQSMARRLDQAWAQASQLASDDCRERLIKTLVRFSESEAASPTPEGVVLRITHAQLAQAVGAARETVSVCLTHLRQSKIIRTGRNRLFFDPENLKSLKTTKEVTKEV